ncbi:TBC1 domain family member 10B [Sphaerodactylus townsendi]|uniref:TBC1 domain family member 10B n=1 Tax=Sphaerodactylus townsendi TaxID=933632 RepID=UPI0020271F5E|nr:TBC1 domain family member 10B [Sphaerodactylus townsendi]
METSSGDPPSPPPRYNSPRSMLHAMKGMGSAPMASVETDDSRSGSPLAAANLVTVDPVEATKTEASCVSTETSSTVMTIEMSLVARDNGDAASLDQGAGAGEVAVDGIPAADASSAATLPGVKSVAPVPTVATTNGMSATSSPQDRIEELPVTLFTGTKMKPLPVPPTSPVVVVVAPSPGSPPEKISPTGPGSSEPQDQPSSQPPGFPTQPDLDSQPNQGTPAPKAPPASDTMSYLESVSLMSGTMESLTGPGFADDASSLGSDSEINGLACRKTDRYGFLGGSQYSEAVQSTIPLDVGRQREMKWVDMLSRWDKWLSRRFQKVKLRCRKGIPSSLRGKAWQLLSNSKELLDQNPGKYEVFWNVFLVFCLVFLNYHTRDAIFRKR